MTMMEERRPVVGAPVVTADGDRIGKVKEVSGDCFKIDAPMQPDYWLGSDTIANVSGGEITLSLRKEDVGEVKVDRPEEHLGSHRHTA